MNAPVTPKWIDSDDRPVPPRRLSVYAVRELMLPLIVTTLLSGAAVYAFLADRDMMLTSTMLWIASSFVTLLFLTGKLVRAWPVLRLLLEELRERVLLLQMLERSMPAGRVFEGLDAAGAEADYVLVHGAGIFAVSVAFLPEAPAGAGAADFDGDFLRVEGAAPWREPVVRSRHVARQLAECLAERMRSWPRVTALLLVVGREVRQPQRLDPGMFAVGKAGVGALLGRLATVMDNQEVAQVSRTLDQMAHDAARRRWSFLPARPHGD
jgi:hypothetical protein